MWSRGTMALIMEFKTTCKPANISRTCDGRFLNPFVCVFLTHLLTGNSGDKAKGTKDTKGSEGLDVEPPRFASRLSTGVSVFGDHLQSHTEQPGNDRAERNGEKLQTNTYTHSMYVEVQKWLCICPLVCTGKQTTAALPQHTPWIIAKNSCQNSPNNDNNKIQQVPAVSDVRVLVHDQTVGNDLQKCLYRENDQEGIFHRFLWGGEEKKKSMRQVRKRRGDHVKWRANGQGHEYFRRQKLFSN